MEEKEKVKRRHGSIISVIDSDDFSTRWSHIDDWEQASRLSRRRTSSFKGNLSARGPSALVSFGLPVEWGNTATRSTPQVDKYASRHFLNPNIHLGAINNNAVLRANMVSPRIMIAENFLEKEIPERKSTNWEYSRNQEKAKEETRERSRERSYSDRMMLGSLRTVPESRIAKLVSRRFHQALPDSCSSVKSKSKTSIMNYKSPNSYRGYYS